MIDNAGSISAPSLHLTFGRIVDVHVGPRAYTVQLSSETTIQCSAVAGVGSTQSLSPKQLGVYPVGTDVIVAVPVSRAYNLSGNNLRNTLRAPGYIVGSCSMPMGSDVLRTLDWIGLPIGADAANDPCHQLITDKPKQFRDYNVGLPLDVIEGSDEGTINELGVGSGISRWFSWIRASDVAGLWCFYLDNLTRLAAYNYEFWTCGGERWIKNDEGEINDVELFTPYPWEASGLVNAKVGKSFELKPAGSMYKKDQYALSLEPRYADQTILPRYMSLRGYIGDAHRELVVLPKPDPSKGSLDSFVERKSHKTDYTGVLDVHKHSSGLYSVRSAQGIVHEKYLYIPVPKQLCDPEEADAKKGTAGGDGATNYKPAGAWGEGTSELLNTLHDKQPWPWTRPDRSDLWAAEYFDYSAYMFNWYGYKPLLAHLNDWYVTDSGYFNNETAGTSYGAYDPGMTMGDAFIFPLPQFASIAVDHRKGDTKYYYSRSVIAQLPDGSILIEDGYGTSMHMSGGNMHLTCAGDVWMRPGRCMITWAGDDIVLRAGSSIDITASNADVRLKAERNMHLLAGNSGMAGGVLIESRSVYGEGGAFIYKDVVGEDVASYGVTIKTPSSPVMIYGKDIYGRALSFTEGGGDDVGGNIEFEADTNMVTSAAEHVAYAETGLSQIIGQKISAGGSLSGSSIVNRFDLDNTIISSKELFRASAKVAVVDSPDGLYSTGIYACSGGIVPFPGDTSAVINGFTADYTAWINGAFTTLLAYQYADMYNTIKSNDTFMTYLGFTCRNETQYGIGSDFLLSEARWQQVYRIGERGILWYEPAVNILGVTAGYTRPHPGNVMWTEYQDFMIYDSDLWTYKDADGNMALWDWDRDASTPDTSEYTKAYTSRDDTSSTAFKAKFINLAYLVSRQYGQTV